MIRDVWRDLLQRCADVGISFPVSLVSDHILERDLGEEKAMRLFRNPRKAIRKWRMRALFIDLHKTKVTICAPRKRHVPPWIFKRLMAYEVEETFS